MQHVFAYFENSKLQLRYTAMLQSGTKQDIWQTDRGTNLSAVQLGPTLIDSWLWILRGIESLITHNCNYRRTRQTHKALKQDEHLLPLLPSAHISQIPLKLKEEQGSWRHNLRERDTHTENPYLVQSITEELQSIN